MKRLLAEVLYRVGRALSWLDHHIFGHLYFERGRFVINCSLYPIYNRLFVWSADLS